MYAPKRFLISLWGGRIGKVGVMSKRVKNKIRGRFFCVLHQLLDSKAFIELSPSAKACWLYFMKDKKTDHHPIRVVLTFNQAVKAGVCKSPNTFNKLKRELVAHGLLDQIEVGGLNKPAAFELSDRWEMYGTDDFKEWTYKAGVGNKYFARAMKVPELKTELLEARGNQSRSVRAGS